MATFEDLDKEYQKMFGVPSIAKVEAPLREEKAPVALPSDLDRDYQSLFGRAIEEVAEPAINEDATSTFLKAKGISETELRERKGEIPTLPFEEKKEAWERATEISRRAWEAAYPEEIDATEYFRKGLTFGWGPDLPTVPATTLKQKAMQAGGFILSATYLQQILSPVIGAGLAKVPGVAKPLAKLLAEAAKHPWKIGYPLSVGRSTLWGTLVGALHKAESKIEIAQNALRGGLTYGAFQALAYPVLQFFKPVFYELASDTKYQADPNVRKMLGTKGLETIYTKKDPIWFRHPTKTNVIVKVTESRIDVVSATQAPKAITHYPVFGKAELEAFHYKPSLFNQLKDLIAGRIKTIPIPKEPMLPAITVAPPVKPTPPAIVPPPVVPVVPPPTTPPVPTPPIAPPAPPAVVPTPPEAIVTPPPKVEVPPKDIEPKIIEEVRKPKEIESLTQQAKKFPYAEDFWKAQPKVFYRVPQGVALKFDTFSDKHLIDNPDLFGKGFYFYGNAEEAHMQRYAIKSAFVDIKNPYVIELKNKNIELEKNWTDPATYIKQLKKEGFDGVVIKREDESIRDMMPFDVSQIKTRPQLLDIWKEAKKVVKPEVKLQKDIYGEAVKPEIEPEERRLRLGVEKGILFEKIKGKPLTSEEYQAERIRLEKEKRRGQLEIPTKVIKPKAKPKKPLPDWFDEIDKIIYGRNPMRIPTEYDKADWIETVGKGGYMKIFRNVPTLMAADEMAESLGMTTDELREKIAERLRHPTQKKSPEQLFEEEYAKEVEQQLKIFDEEKISRLVGEPEQEIDVFKMFAEEEKGFVKIPSLQPLVDIYNRMHDWIFTFGEARRISPELYDRLMQAFGRRNAGIEKAVQEVEKIVGQKIATKDAVELSLIYEDKRLRPPERLKEIFTKFRILFDTIERKGLEQRIFARTFQERMLEEIDAKIITLKEQLKHPAKSKKIQSLLQDREKIIQMRYLPHNIVAQRAIEAKLKTLEGEERKVFLTKLSRISFRFKMRTGRKFLAEYLEDGLLEPQDLDIRKLAAETLSDYYYRSSLKTLFDWGKTQGLIKTASAELRGQGWLNAREIGISSPELKTQMVHPMLASSYAEMKAMKIRKGFVGRQILGTIKIAQFIKPQIIWIYDGVQKLMRGTFSLNPIKEAGYLAKSIKEVLTKGKDYHKMNALNLYQFPYEVSRASRDQQIKMMVRRTSKDVPKWIKKIESLIGKPVTLTDLQARDLLMIPYRVMANATWTGDKIIRSTSFYALKDMGYSEAESAKIAGRAHGAYSELSEAYKKTMSPITFVHSFRVLMPIEMARTIQEPVEGILRGIVGKDVPKRDLSRWAKAIIATILIPVAIDIYMKARGFEKTGVHLGPLAWKYKKTVVVSGKKSEIFVGVNYILNMPLKWFQRLTYYNPIDPQNRFKQALTNFMRWEVHPAWRIFFWDIVQNRPSFADVDYVYDPNAHWVNQTGQIARYTFGQAFRFWGTLMDDLSEGERTAKEKEDQEKIFDEGLTGFDRALTSIFGYKYTRQNLPQRQIIMRRWLDSEYEKRQFVIAKKYKGTERQKQLQELRK